MGECAISFDFKKDANAVANIDKPPQIYNRF